MKSPSIDVMVPTVSCPLILIVAPMIGSPISSRTIPVTVVDSCCTLATLFVAGDVAVAFPNAGYMLAVTPSIKPFSKRFDLCIDLLFGFLFQI